MGFRFGTKYSLQLIYISMRSNDIDMYDVCIVRACICPAQWPMGSLRTIIMSTNKNTWFCLQTCSHINPFKTHRFRNERDWLNVRKGSLSGWNEAIKGAITDRSSPEVTLKWFIHWFSCESCRVQTISVSIFNIAMGYSGRTIQNSLKASTLIGHAHPAPILSHHTAPIIVLRRAQIVASWPRLEYIVNAVVRSQPHPIHSNRRTPNMMIWHTFTLWTEQELKRNRVPTMFTQAQITRLICGRCVL